MLKLMGIKIGKGIRLVGPIYINYGTELSIGDNTFIGMNFAIRGNGNVKIGNNCDIAPDVMCLTGTHNIGNHAHRAGDGYCSDVVVGDGCWICARSTIMGSVTIGDGCVIGACSFVNKSVEPDELVAGVPAKLVRELEKIYE